MKARRDTSEENRGVHLRGWLREKQSLQRNFFSGPESASSQPMLTLYACAGRASHTNHCFPSDSQDNRARPRSTLSAYELLQPFSHTVPCAIRKGTYLSSVPMYRGYPSLEHGGESRRNLCLYIIQILNLASTVRGILFLARRVQLFFSLVHAGVIFLLLTT